MKKYIPNVITIVRMLCAAPLLMLIHQNRAAVGESCFWRLWLFCGVSDAVDGALARRWRAASPAGTLLDTIADAAVFIPMAYIFWLHVRISQHIVIWICVIFAIRLISLLVGAVKFHTLVILHTWPNKLTGVLLYLLPLMSTLYEDHRSVGFLCIIASCAAAEELLILCTSNTLNRDVRGFWETLNNS